MYNRAVIICGSASGMWDQLASAVNLVGINEHIRIAGLNVAGIFVPHLDDWFITSMCNVKPMIGVRESISPVGDCGMSETTVHTPGQVFLPTLCEKHRYWPVTTKGTISMFAIRVLSSMGYNRMILAGVPLDDKAGYFYRAPWEQFGMSAESRAYWVEAVAQLKPYVRSMGGWTQELLGAPTLEWLQGGD